jgi:hypothetical protein
VTDKTVDHYGTRSVRKKRKGKSHEMPDNRHLQKRRQGWYVRVAVPESLWKTVWLCMVDNSQPPLSPTVEALFAEFLKRLEAEKVLTPPAFDALKSALKEQKLDTETLRAALSAKAGAA